jgi:hypothetical protein
MVGVATSSGCSRPARSRDGARECPDGPPRTRLSLAIASKYPSSWSLAHCHGVARCRRVTIAHAGGVRPGGRPWSRASGVVLRRHLRSAPPGRATRRVPTMIGRRRRRSSSRRISGTSRESLDGSRPLAPRPRASGHAPAVAAVSVKLAGPPAAGVSGTVHVTLPRRPTKTNCRARISWPRRRSSFRRSYHLPASCCRRSPVAGPGSPRRSAAPPDTRDRHWYCSGSSAGTMKRQSGDRAGPKSPAARRGLTGRSLFARGPRRRTGTGGPAETGRASSSGSAAATSAGRTRPRGVREYAR